MSRFIVFFLIVAALGGVGYGCSERPTVKFDQGLDGILILDTSRQDLLPPWTWPEAGDLVAADTVKADSDRCVGAKELTFSAGKASYSGTTSGAVNEFGKAIRCGEIAAFTGPQRYHKVPMTRGRAYRISLTPQFAAVFYLFTDCSENIINVDCTSGGATGFLSQPVASGSTKTVLFKPKATGSYRVAVDSASISQAGSYTLTITEILPPPNQKCASAQAVTLGAGGMATIKGSTGGASNEFSKSIGCGLGVDFDGPQVYYSISLTKGTWYKLSLTPDFPAALYVANAQSKCKPSNLNTDCGSRAGTVLPLVSQGATLSTAFSPVVSGTYLLAVDSMDPLASGDFVLAVETFTPAPGMTCPKATPLTLNSGKASVKGSTGAFFNDLGAHVTCGAGAPLVGPQNYFSVKLQKKTYQVALKPTFAATLALGSQCLTLPADCGSGGLSGATLQVTPGTTGSLLFSPYTAGSYVVSVDSASSTAKGAFELLVQEYIKPTHGSCSSPKTISLSTSPAQEIGDTGPLSNDLKGVNCGGTVSWSGPQAYYKVSLAAGKTYTVQLTPEATFDPAIYAFPATTACAATGLNTACKGQASDKVGAGVNEILTLSPPVATEMILVVDSWSPSEVGDFTLKVSW